MPNGPSYRALPRLYPKTECGLSLLSRLAFFEWPCTGTRANLTVHPEYGSCTHVRRRSPAGVLFSICVRSPVAVIDAKRAACLICGGTALEDVPSFTALPRVTSDSKPWPAGGQLAICTGCGAVQKHADTTWRAEAAMIYGAYTMYHHAAGAEQAVFDASGGGMPRSDRLARHLAESLNLPEHGQILDFGCSNGMLLAAFGRLRPGWALSGVEIDDRILTALQRIPGFSALHTCAPEQVPGYYRLITLSHTFEHLGEPVAVLAALVRRLQPDGNLFVQVPDCARNPYDLLVADHLLHFTAVTLALTADRAGCVTIALSDCVVIKELSWLGRAAPAAPTILPLASEDVAAVRARVNAQVTWLATQMRTAGEIVTGSTRFGLFGTGPAGTWLAGALGERVAFFVDEDPARIGRSHLGRPVHGPHGVPNGADVFIPLIPEVATRVAERLSADGRVRYWY